MGIKPGTITGWPLVPRTEEKFQEKAIIWTFVFMDSMGHFPIDPKKGD